MWINAKCVCRLDQFFNAPVLFLDIDYVASSIWLLLFAVQEQRWAEVRSGDIKMDGGM